MWPFRKKELPPPPELVTLSVNSAVVRYCLQWLDRYPNVTTRLIEERPAIVVFKVEHIGTAIAKMYLEDGYPVLEFQDWLGYDPHHRKRPKDYVPPTLQSGDAEIRIVPTAWEQVRCAVTFRDEYGNVYEYSPTTLLQ